MFIWKEIEITDLEKNKNSLDINRMFKSGAIKSGAIYHALEIERKGKQVTVLARLERGFEEYVVFDRRDYEKIRSISMMTA